MIFTGQAQLGLHIMCEMHRFGHIKKGHVFPWILVIVNLPSTQMHADQHLGKTDPDIPKP